MKNRGLKLLGTSVIVIAFLFFGGCIRNIATLDEYTQNWIGRNIEELKEVDSKPAGYDSYAESIGWKGKTYELDNGHWVYVELDSKDCFIHWEVNPEGIIVGYKLEGDGCKRQ